MKHGFLALPLLMLCACGDYPRDTEGTLERVRGGAMRVGLVAGAPEPRAAALVRKLAERTGARPKVREDAAEPLLLDLEHGRLDLVVGRFDAKTPWDARVTFGKPVEMSGAKDDRREVKAAVRNGEHAWSMEVDRAVKMVAGG